jgi:hypothetical protein
MSTSQDALFGGEPKPEPLPAIIPDGFDPARCSACRARIIWAFSCTYEGNKKLKRGSQNDYVKVPINVRPHPDGTYLVIGLGKVRTILKGELVLAIDRRQAHHATCPKADQLQRKGRA